MSFPVVKSSPGRFFTFRLPPGAKLKEELERVVTSQDRKAACVVTCVGSLTQLTARMANADAETPNEIKSWEERLEICSLVGTLSSTGGSHLHITCSDRDGKCIGGHLIEGTVFTTAEVVLAELSELKFERKMDERTGFP
eukprot:Cvel_6380.t1-p1 / transcript=Cvel_6380.t1 / gene=Cvel_6380 / organism=Chromera_velia_CCMP2878 / gene_product=Bifunctional protein GlmU, putative / transcript_product=Bifunctional protein GlmU, putative / location=Cvel_scaffold311:1-2067(-) / protein_length=139 / sequence_SO=supercontig / SO=protein_coding / is_pseudo=false